ncbi:MAG: RNA methyltransferase [Methylococcaceae bacterium]
MLKHIKIVLVHTSHPGNIGAVARAMKNMDLDRLCLVKPKFFPHADATARASGADDILGKAQVYGSLSEALEECQLVFGASVRSRTIDWLELSPKQSIEKILATDTSVQVAFVFGREDSGLTNAELDLCHALIKIPCNSSFSSLNIAAAVQVICYELYCGLNVTEKNSSNDQQDVSESLATSAQMELFYNHLFETLSDIGFIHPDKSRSLMRRLRKLFNRANVETQEIDILRGILRFAQGNNQK